MSASDGGDRDAMKLLRELNLPAMPDMESVLAAYRRNLEVFSQANRVALEGAQSVAKRHMEIMQQSLAEVTENMKALGTLDSPQAKAAKQAELLKLAYERALAHTKELSELIRTANTEALGLLNQRFIEALDEVKALIEKSGSEKT